MVGSVTIQHATGAYGAMGQLSGSSDAAAGGGAAGLGGASFGDMLRDATTHAIDTVRQGEDQSKLAAAGKGNMTDVVMAVSQAEVMVDTVTAIRDRVVGAYQDIMRMPI